MLAKQIQALHTKRNEHISALEALLKKAEGDDDADARALTEDEQKTFDGTKLEIERIDSRLTNLKDLESIAATRAAPIDPDAQPARPDTLPAQPRQIPTLRNLPKGCYFARLAHVLYTSRRFGINAVDYVEREMRDAQFAMVMRAAVNPAVTSVPAWAGDLVQQLITDFIEMLRPSSIYSLMPSTTVQFDGNGSLKIPRQTVGVPGGWVGEAAPIPVRAGAFDSVQLAPKKLGVITVASREILARSSPALETILRDSMLSDTSIVLDTTFVGNSAATAVAPAGLFAPANAAVAIVGSNTGNAADDAMADATAMLSAMLTVNVPVSNPVWLMHPAAKLALGNMKNAVGVFFFREEVAAGTWMGYPIITSTTIPRTRAGLVDASQLIKGIGFAPEIALSNEAAVSLDDAPTSPSQVTSMFQTDSTALRLTMEASWVTRRTTGVQWVNDIKW